MSATAQAIRATLESVNESDRNLEPANVVDGLFAIARGLQSVASALRELGNGNAATPMGAIEGIGAIFIENITPAIGDIASAIREHSQ